MFNLMEIKTVKVTEMSDLTGYLENEGISYLPMSNFISDESGFFLDGYIGKPKDYVEFNELGFKSFCSVFNLPIDFIIGISQTNLASQVLNDFFISPDVREKVSNYQFVIESDSDRKTVIGVVSKSYVPYSNQKFFSDLRRIFGDTLKEFEIEECFVINSDFYLRLLSIYDIGSIYGSGRLGVDICHYGVQLSNSMVGNKSIRASYFIRRLVCSNGLTINVAEGIGRVMHSGNADTFNTRLRNNIIPVFNNISLVPSMVESLADIPFNPDRVSELGGADLVYNIKPLNFSDDKKRRKLIGTKLHEFDSTKMCEYIERYAGEHSKNVFDSYWIKKNSMFDFVNLFTEYAKTLKTKDRLFVEEKCGDLVNWSIQHKYDLTLPPVHSHQQVKLF